jgi:NADH-quinone oxidoreductase subunit L
MNPEDFTWIALGLPLLAAFIITLFTRRDPKFSAGLSIAAVAFSFLISVVLYFLMREADYLESHVLRWLNVGGLDVNFYLRVDHLSMLMMLIVTGVGGAIHVYSAGYMHDDPGASRYFAGLSLFTFSMLGIVLSSNFVMMFIFWELVGLSSYLLIGFWYERPSAADACKKAFITNRLGDFGFLLGIILIWSQLGTVDFVKIRSMLLGNPSILGSWATIAGLLIFCGAMGKSAQFPLHVWLPDAMEGPTPVSALIHAATMVAAGVYMLCRVFFLYNATQLWPDGMHFLDGITALQVIAWIGGITALLSAVIAIQQNDIKRILAYSTLSQLGYMVMAVGLAAPSPAMFHLTTHAFFKALLFLGAGSVIMMAHHEQDIWKMGGLRAKMPVTFWTFLIATLALCGVPPFSGFYSKDEILARAYEHNTPLFILATFVAFLTTLYMFRLMFVAFFGKPRSEAAEHAHESPTVMTGPLLALAVPSVIAGVAGINYFIDTQFGGAESDLSFVQQIIAPFSHAPFAAMAGLGAFIFGLGIAFAIYSGAAKDPLSEKLGFIAKAMRSRFYFDELYHLLILITHEALSFIANWIDRWLLGGLAIRGLHGTTEIAGRTLRLMQTGNLQTYAFWIVIGLSILLFFALK